MANGLPYSRLLEHIVGEIRNKELRQEGESIDAWAKRTWAMALAEYEKEKPELPHTVEARERTERLLKGVGTPEKEN